MPHYQISRVNGKLQSRWLRSNFIICERIIEDRVHIFWAPTGGFSPEATERLIPNDSLEVYISSVFMDKTIVVSMSHLPKGVRIADYMDRLVAFEDKKLKIIYLKTIEYFMN